MASNGSMHRFGSIAFNADYLTSLQKHNTFHSWKEPEQVCVYFPATDDGILHDNGCLAVAPGAQCGHLQGLLKPASKLALRSL